MNDKAYIETLENHLKRKSHEHDKARLKLGMALTSIMEEGDSVRTRKLVREGLDILNGRD